MIVARLSLPGQSAPGPDPGRPGRQRERKHIIGLSVSFNEYASLQVTTRRTGT